MANKDDVLSGMVDLVVTETEVPGQGTDWRAAMRDRALSAHEVLLAHPWAATQITFGLELILEGLERQLATR